MFYLGPFVMFFVRRKAGVIKALLIIRKLFFIVAQILLHQIDELLPGF